MAKMDYYASLDRVEIIGSSLMKKLVLLSCLTVFGLPSLAIAADDITPFVGRWALDIPGDRAGWLGIEDKGNYCDATILWGGGSVVDVVGVYVDGDTLHILRDNKVVRKDENGKRIKTHNQIEQITATVDGDSMSLVQIVPKKNGKGVSSNPFKGKRIAPLPPVPDLSKLKFGNPIDLLGKNDLEGWKLLEPGNKNGWSVTKGVLENDPADKKGRYGNLRTVGEFDDFNLKLEVTTKEGGNSGVYLRGIYEVQVFDSYGKPLDSHNMGAIYSRITPSVNAEKPVGKWSALDITLVDRHVTVKLNDKTIIDNQPLMGCTGGAMTSDEFKSGPIYLQGDHGFVKYRNIVLTPIIH
jgi:hypothetical protein